MPAARDIGQEGICGMNNQKTEIRGTFVIDKDAKPWTPETAARAVFGMSLEELIKDIQENRGGKYDSLYIKAARDSGQERTNAG